MKPNRQAKILELIESKDIETQEQLLQELEACGFATTQATISRDIKELRIIKELGENGSYRYSAVPKQLETNASANAGPGLRRLLRHGFDEFGYDRRHPGRG